MKQALLLAAGLSTRLRPLTNEIPKPLLPFWKVRQLDVTLAYLRANGIEEVATNAHHGREKYLAALGDPALPYRVRAFEEPVILGTGGGIRNMKPFVTDATFAVLNCDFVTDVGLQMVASFHGKKKALATMVLIDSPLAPRYGEIGIDASGRIVEFPHGRCPGGAVRSGFFSGIHVFDRAIFDEMPEQDVFCINRDVYAPLIERDGPVFGLIVKNRWFDTGELKEYRETQAELLKRPFDWLKPLLP